MGPVRWLFDTSGFVPRWFCGDWPEALGYTHIAADLLIFASYVAIPAALAVLVLRRRDAVQVSFLMWLFVAFILSCGVAHLVEATLFYRPWYRLSAVLKAETALVSALTAVVLARHLPSLLMLPSAKVEKDELERTLETERSSSAVVSAARVDLEARSADLTLRLRRVMTAMQAAEVCALRWTVETGAVDWQKGYDHIRRLVGTGLPLDLESWEGLLGGAEASRLRDEARRACAAGKAMEFVSEGLGGRALALRLSAAPEPEVKGQARTMIGMFRVF